MSTPLKIVIADDHPVFRQGLRQILEQHPFLQVVEEAENGEKTVRAVEQLNADILVLDIRMPVLDGFSVVRRLKEKDSTTKVIFLTMHDEEDIFQEAMDLGVKGYVLKDTAASDILEGIQTIARGKRFISPSLSEYVFRRQEKAESFHNQQPGLAALTPSEKKILKMISENMISKEIAATLGLSVRTVENHRARICQKLRLHGVHSLVKFAFDNRPHV